MLGSKQTQHLSLCICRSESKIETQKREMEVAAFYSKSRDVDDIGAGFKDWRKRLSNFWPVQITVGGRMYASVEHAFHAAKARCSDKPAYAEAFECGGTVGAAPAKAKAAGGRRGFAKAGAVLHTVLWDRERDGATMAALRARAQCDTEFCTILRRTAELRLRLLHYDGRGGAASYWGGKIDKMSGCVVGHNRLGEMLMELRDEFSTQ